jgi:hypothetical protein
MAKAAERTGTTLSFGYRAFLYVGMVGMIART